MSAVEGGQTCQACRRIDQPANPIPMNRLLLPGYGHEWACIDTVACRKAAQAQGIHGRVPGRSTA